ncbi:hypothetical protein L596_025776 [Steinernema carpocapsae]|uniref:Uncharacterized protein n=1 Tax=Steinernema carpocapsae TaxID=34508 RepID=A0A4U5M9U4_STECR|nr:hypothetical protein L596_025776 [Steinernema carpocapsae]
MDLRLISIRNSMRRKSLRFLRHLHGSAKRQNADPAELEFCASPETRLCQVFEDLRIDLQVEVSEGYM